MGVPGGLLPHTVTRVRPVVTTDAYGNKTWSYGPCSDRKTVRAWMQQTSRDEPTSPGRDPLVQTWLMITNDSDIQGRDWIKWRSPAGVVLVYEVEGPPAPVCTPTGYHHTESTLRVVSG